MSAARIEAGVHRYACSELRLGGTAGSARSSWEWEASASGWMEARKTLLLSNMALALQAIDYGVVWGYAGLRSSGFPLKENYPDPKAFGQLEYSGAG